MGYYENCNTTQAHYRRAILELAALLLILAAAFHLEPLLRWVLRGGESGISPQLSEEILRAELSTFVDSDYARKESPAWLCFFSIQLAVACGVNAAERDPQLAADDLRGFIDQLEPLGCPDIPNCVVLCSAKMTDATFVHLVETLNLCVGKFATRAEKLALANRFVPLLLELSSKKTEEEKELVRIKNILRP